MNVRDVNSPTAIVKPSEEDYGVYLCREPSVPIWFAYESHAVEIAKQVYPDHEIVVLNAQGEVVCRHAPSRPE